MFDIRTKKPGAGNKFYNNGNNGGYSWCINGSPMDKNCNVLSNCVGYACGRFNEIYSAITGYQGMKYKTLCCNAENFIEAAKKAGLEVGSVPKPGAIMCWQAGATLNGKDGAGHVAVVEKVYDNNHVYTSESAWGSTAFFNAHRYNTKGNWGISGYKFRGFIYNPAVKEDPKPEPKPEPTYKYKIGDDVIISGNLYISADARNASGSVKSKVTKITRISKGSAHPYNTTGDLGWMDEACIKPYDNDKLTDEELLSLVRKTIRGDYGNNEQRVKALGKHYDEVQYQVEKNLNHDLTDWDEIRLFK